MHILLVDDEPEFADFVRRGLSYEGYTVEVVHSASAGVDETGRQGEGVTR